MAELPRRQQLTYAMREAAFDEVAVPSHRGRFISAECHGGRGVVSPAGSAVGWFDRAARQYRHIPADEQCEVLSLIGDVAESQDGRIPHAHVVLALPDGTRAEATSSRDWCSPRWRSW
jgi:hypothetical protein